MWTTASGDEQLGLVYLPMGNATADYYSVAAPAGGEFLRHLAGGARRDHRQAAMAFPGGAQRRVGL